MSRKCKVQPKKIPLHPEIPVLALTADRLKQDDLYKQFVEMPIKKSLREGLMAKLRSGSLTDSIVKIGKARLRVHRMVLQCYSRHFQQITGVMVNGTRTFKMHEEFVSAEAFRSIYTWMLDGVKECHRNLNKHNIFELLVGAQNLGISQLEEQCWSFLDGPGVFYEDGAYFAFVKARKLGLNSVVQMMLDRIKSFFQILMASNEFLNIKVRDLCSLLSSNYVQIHTETEILMSGIRWLKHCWPARQKHVVRVMSCVRFALIPPQTLIALSVNKESRVVMLIMEYPEVQDMLEGGLSRSVLLYARDSEDEILDTMKISAPKIRNFSGTHRVFNRYSEFLVHLVGIHNFCCTWYQVNRTETHLMHLNFWQIVERNACGHTVEHILMPRKKRKRQLALPLMAMRALKPPPPPPALVMPTPPPPRVQRLEQQMEQVEQVPRRRRSQSANVATGYMSRMPLRPLQKHDQIWRNDKPFSPPGMTPRYSQLSRPTETVDISLRKAHAPLLMTADNAAHSNQHRYHNTLFQHHQKTQMPCPGTSGLQSLQGHQYDRAPSHQHNEVEYIENVKSHHRKRERQSNLNDKELLRHDQVQCLHMSGQRGNPQNQSDRLHNRRPELSHDMKEIVQPQHLEEQPRLIRLEEELRRVQARIEWLENHEQPTEQCEVVMHDISKKECSRSPTRGSAQNDPWDQARSQKKRHQHGNQGKR